MIEEEAYISLKADCDCLVMATMASRKGAAVEVAQAIRNGERVQRVSAETVRTMPFRCQLHPRVVPEQQLGLP